MWQLQFCLVSAECAISSGRGFNNMQPAKWLHWHRARKRLSESASAWSGCQPTGTVPPNSAALRNKTPALRVLGRANQSHTHRPAAGLRAEIILAAAAPYWPNLFESISLAAENALVPGQMP